MNSAMNISHQAIRECRHTPSYSHQMRKGASATKTSAGAGIPSLDANAMDVEAGASILILGRLSAEVDEMTDIAE